MDMESIARVVVPILCLAVGGLVGWVWALWRDHHEHKLHVATNFVQNKALNQVRREIRFLQGVTLQIARSLRIQVGDPPGDSDD